MICVQNAMDDLCVYMSILSFANVAPQNGLFIQHRVNKFQNIRHLWEKFVAKMNK